MICECGHTNQWDHIWKLCAYHVQARLVLPPAQLAQLSPAPSWHEKAPREVIARKVQEARREVIDAIRSYTQDRRATRVKGR